MATPDTDLRDFLTVEILHSAGGPWFHDIVEKNTNGTVEEKFDIWTVLFDFDRGTINLCHDFDPRDSTFSIAEFMSALDTHIATLRHRRR